MSSYIYISVLFECIEVGDVFEYRDSLYMRVEDSVLIKGAQTFNAVNIIDARVIYIDDEETVKTARKDTI